MRDLDRRWIFLAIAVVLIVFLWIRFPLPQKIDPEVREAFDAVEALSPGDRVVLCANYGPSSEPELGPMHLALLYHLFARDVRVIACALWNTGPDMVEAYLEEVLPAFPAGSGGAKGEGRSAKRYGIDYVDLGFMEGREIVMTTMGSSIPEAFPVDRGKTPVEAFPIMEGIGGLGPDPETGERAIALLVELSAGNPGAREWLRQVQRRYDVRMIAGVTSVMAPDLYAFRQSGQLLGFLGGLPGAAQYASLLLERGILTDSSPLYERTTRVFQDMNIQSAIHLLIIAFIVLGNILYFLGRRRGV